MQAEARHGDNCALTLPVYSAVKLNIEAYDAEDCPICKEGKIALEKPGSREMKK